MLDSKALRILKKSRRSEPTASEREILRKNGVLWEKSPMTHDELIKQIKAAAEKTDFRKAADGFLYSVSSGDLRYRTAISSLIWARALTEHECAVPEKNWHRFNKYRCKICGGTFSDITGKTAFDETEGHRDRLAPAKEFMDICCADYILCDLEYFAGLPDVAYCDEDIRIINRMLGLAGEISPANKVNALLDLIAAEKTINLSGADTYSVLGVLSSCGLFDTPEHKSCMSGFVNFSDLGFMYDRDIYYPLVHWRGKYGINYDAVKNVFGADIAEKISPGTALKGEAVRKAEKKKASASAAEMYFRDGEHIIDMNDRYRYYYGLSPLDPDWDKKVMYSVTHGIYKRTEVYFEGDVIKKYIYEEMTENGCRYYVECDTDAPTKNRELLLPKTSRGRPKNITPSLLQTPTYMNAHLMVHIYPHEKGGEGAMSFNSSNDQQLPLPFRTMYTKEDFVKYTEDYIASCPPDYAVQLDNFINKKRRTVKFTAGDIFRIQVDVTHYTYCLILGKVREFLKWKEIPEGHPFFGVMTQPIVYRQYAVITENDAMTAEELEKIPLLPMEIAQDNEVLWETYPIVSSKKLKKNDIDLGFMADAEERTVIWGLTMHTFENELDSVFFGDNAEKMPVSKAYNVKTEKNFYTYGVAIGINYFTRADSGGRITPPETKDDVLKKRIAGVLGLDPEAPEDDFAERYGGITREKYIELAEERFKR